MRSCLLCKFIQPEAMYINLFAILRVFLVGFVGSDLGKQELAEFAAFMSMLGEKTQPF